jgi:hypothetical protein
MSNAVPVESSAVNNSNYIFIMATLQSRLYHAEIAYATTLDTLCATRTEPARLAKETASATLIQVRKDIAAVDRHPRA